MLSNYPAGVTEVDFEDRELWRQYLRYMEDCKVDGFRPLPFEEWIADDEDDNDD